MENQVTTIFDSFEQEKNGYHLHAICVHDGDADSGHYFIFIKDHHNNIWRKFNDSNVTIVQYDEVLFDSLGGNGKKTAFWVFYLSNEKTELAKQHNLYNNEMCSYRKLIDMDLAY